LTAEHFPLTGCEAIDITTCYLCGRPFGDKPTDKDHVPPDRWIAKGFARLRPAQLLMLPVHEQCQNAEVAGDDPGRGRGKSGILEDRDYRAAGSSGCTNDRVIKRKEVERRVLAALQQRFLTKERLDELTRLYVAETNRLRAEHRAKLGRGTARVGRQQAAGNGDPQLYEAGRR
jgi:hypothetical protein